IQFFAFSLRLGALAGGNFLIQSFTHVPARNVNFCRILSNFVNFFTYFVEFFTLFVEFLQVFTSFSLLTRVFD
ncbi:MAG: hypothetical protein ACYSSL_08740, partial [Planctomycetota bacterium]